MARQSALRWLDPVEPGAPIGQVRTWTLHAEVEREHTRELARFGNSLNQIARWANTDKEAIEVISQLVAIDRALSALDPAQMPDADAHQVSGARNWSGWGRGQIPHRGAGLHRRAAPSRRGRSKRFPLGGIGGGHSGVEHRYTSGVIAWAPEDELTDKQIGAVLDAFEETAWAGLEPDRYAWAAAASPPILARIGACVSMAIERAAPATRPAASVLYTV